MYFNSKFAALLLVVAGSGVATAAITSRDELATLAVVLYADTGFRGEPHSASPLVRAQCFTLPSTFQAKAQSLKIASGYTCQFFNHVNCQGTGIPLSGDVPVLGPDLYDDIDSFICDRT